MFHADISMGDQLHVVLIGASCRSESMRCIKLRSVNI